MAYASSSDWVERLEREGELLRVREPACVELEIAAAADLESKSVQGGKALYFEKPVRNDGRAYGFPVLINGYGSARRMAMALGRERVEEIGDEVGALVRAKPPAGISEAWDLFKRGLELRHARPVSVGRGASQEVVHRVEDGGEGLGKIPVLKTWPKDGGPFLTLPQVITEDPETKERNVGMYRMQVLGPWEAALHWQLHKVGARHGKKYREMGKPMPVAVALGGDPANAFAATAPLPDGIDEYMFAGFLRKQSVEFVPAVSQPIRVPADADFVIEGTVDPVGEPVDEGPFGDHTGFYTPVDKYPRFRVTAITHRNGAIYPATVVGKPPMEDFWLGSASVRILLPVLKMNFPELVDLALPAEGVFHNLALVSLKKQYPYQAFKLMHGLWGAGQMMFTKIIIAVDAEVNVHDTGEVLFYLGANVDPERDTIFIKSPCDSLDHATTFPNVGSHMGIDATRKLPGEGYVRGWPEECRTTPEARARAHELLAAARRGDG
ncbi:MAG: menaquinone biosynthesis decarboxylase [Verrucomicrobia bacterium]|nr:menaquinone biosynthesis decarboxylase [Verrucomicrobiota bacterium]